LADMSRLISSMSNEELAGLIQRLSEQSIRTEDKLEKLIQNPEPKVQFGQRQQARGPPLPDECQVGAFGGLSPTVAVRPAPATSQDGWLSDQSAGELYTLIYASLTFLQDEYGCLFVGAMGDERTAKILKYVVLFEKIHRGCPMMPSMT
jgi:hypothetical protein